MNVHVLAVAAPSTTTGAGFTLLVILGAVFGFLIKFKKVQILSFLTSAAFGGLLFTETDIGPELHDNLVDLTNWALKMLGQA